MLSEINAQECLDVNECLENNGGCEMVCINEEGTHSCDCDPGYELGTDGYSCDDVNECAVDNGGCDQTCENLDGGFKCLCEAQASK